MIFLAHYFGNVPECGLDFLAGAGCNNPGAVEVGRIGVRKP